MKKLLSLPLICLGMLGGAKAQTCGTTITSYPYNETFDGATAPGWASGGTASSWALGTPAKTVINSAASGTKSWVTNLNGNYNANENSWVESPCFNMSTLAQPVVEMKVWWNSEFSYDGAVLQSSIDGGTTWQNVGAKGDPNNWFNDNTLSGAPGGQPAATAQGWTGRNSTGNGSGGWVIAKHALTGLGGKPNVKLRIAFGSDGFGPDEGFAFDNFNIYDSPASDAGVTAIISPNSGCGLSNQETITITVKNYGSAALTNIPVSYKINTGTPVTETMAGPVAPNATLNYSFTTKANLGTPGNYTIVSSTSMPADLIAINDDATKTVTVTPTISNLPYAEGFENGAGGWAAGGTASSWALGTPAKSVINSAATGSKSWVTSLTGLYNNDEKSYVVSPCFNFSGKGDPDFEMKVWWESEFSYDGAVLQSSIDGGATWQNVGAKGDPNNWFNDNTLSGAPGGQPVATAEGWTGLIAKGKGSGGWVIVKHALTGLGGKPNVKLRIAFGSDIGTQYDGFAFDDIRIGDNTNNLAVNSIIPINKLCGLSASEPITAVIGNLGNAPATGFTVSYSVNKGTPVVQNFTGSLAAGASTNVTLSPGANLSAAGSYKIVVVVKMPGDLDATNDTATYSISNATFTNLPLMLDFETPATGISSLKTVINPKSNITDGTGGSNNTLGLPASTKGMIMDGVDNTSWIIPAGITDPWTNNQNNFSAAYFCVVPTGGAASDSLWLTFDMKQLLKTFKENTNFRVTVDGTQIGATYRPSSTGTPTWQKVKIDLSAYKLNPVVRIGLESSVKEEYANGTGTANLIDNIEIKRRIAKTTGVKENIMEATLHIFPNPSKGIFNIDLPQGTTYELVVTDLTGKAIRHQQANGNAQLNLEGTAKGIYLLKVSGENGSAVRKLIVE